LGHIYNFLKELKPYDFPNSKRVRLGSDGDGGYVLLNKGLENIEVVYSYGVETNSDFEVMFCEKYNATAQLYDHTVDGAPLQKNFLRFKKEGVGSKKTTHQNTIENHINQNGDSNKRLILKMDVEGAEWDTLFHIPNAILGLFEQIVVEVHDLHSVPPNYDGKNLSKLTIEKRTNVLKKINSLFYLYHVHANNYAPLYYIGRFKLPNVMELTFVNKKYFKSAEHSKTIFPTKFDQPNNPQRADIKPHFWPFCPGTIQHLLHIVTQVGWREGWKEMLSLIYKRFESKWKSVMVAMKLRRPTSYS
jgi:hypothetical protein